MKIVPDDHACSTKRDYQGHHDCMNQDLNVFNAVLLTKKIHIIVIKFQEVLHHEKYHCTIATTTDDTDDDMDDDN